MVRRTRGKKANATRPRRPKRPQPAPEPELDLFDEVADALAEDHPLPLLMLASSMLGALEPSTNPFEPDEPDAPTRDDIVNGLLTEQRSEATALLATIAALDGDELLRRRLDRTTLPGWLADLTDADVVETHDGEFALGDGAYVVLALVLPGGFPLTLVVYVDLIDGAVADVMPFPEPVATVLDHVRSAADQSGQPDLILRPLDPADARARIEEAVGHGRQLVPAPEGEAWPIGRRLVEWAARGLPTGGESWSRPEWSDQERNEVVERFLSSPFGARFDDPEHGDLLDALLWYGTDYGAGDPLRLSPTDAGILLTDWAPRKLMAGPDELARLPDLLAAWVRFGHHERGIRAEHTEEVVEVIDELRPAYLETLDAPPAQDVASLIRGLGAMAGFDEDVLGTGDVDAMRRAMLAKIVGGEEALAALDAAPLPDEPFDPGGVPEELQQRAGEAATLVDGCCEVLHDVEHRTAARRLLARAVAADPTLLSGRGRTDTLAAAVCSMVVRANQPDEGPRSLVKDVAAHFGLTSGTVSQRTQAVVAAVDADNRGHEIVLRTSDLLVSRRRAEILARRDRPRVDHRG